MTKTEEHKASIKAFLEDINEKIMAKKLFERQKIVGFDVSEASVNIFELYLHRKNLITEGYNVNHRFFSSKKMADDRFPFPFPKKDQIISYMVDIENTTTKLCYGKSKRLEDVEKAIKLFLALKGTIEKELGEEI